MIELDVTTALGVVIASVITPFFVAIATNKNMTSDNKRRIAIIMSVVVGAITAIVTGAIDGIPQAISAGLVRAVLIIAAIAGFAQNVYALFKTQIEKVEDAVNLPIGSDSTG